MKKIFFALVGNIFLLTNKAFADDVGIYWWISGVTPEEKVAKLRNWNISFGEIPWMILYVINFLLWIVATVYMIMIIVWAFQLMLWSVSSEKNKWKDSIKWWIIWFLVSAGAWFIMRLVIWNLIK